MSGGMFKSDGCANSVPYCSSIIIDMDTQMGRRG